MVGGRCTMGVHCDSFVATPQLRSLTLASMDVWGWPVNSLRHLTALTRLEVTEGWVESVPTALTDVGQTLKELALELGQGGFELGSKAMEVLLSLGRLELLRIRKWGDSKLPAWSNAEVGRLISFPAAFLARHPERSQPPQTVCS